MKKFYMFVHNTGTSNAERNAQKQEMLVIKGSMNAPCPLFKQCISKKKTPQTKTGASLGG